MSDKKGLRPYGILLLLFLISANFILCTLSAARKSITVDEVVYLAVGHLIVERGMFHINPEQPPFPKAIAALFSRQFKPELPEAGEYVSGFWQNNKDKVQPLTLWGRVPIILLGPILVLLCYLFASRLYGTRAGLLAAFFAALEPTLLAHQRMITPDYPVTVFMLAAMFIFTELYDRLRLGYLFALGVACGLALASKFTAVLLVPFLLLGVLIFALSPTKPTAGRAEVFPRLKPTTANLLYGALILVAGGIIAALLVWTFYNFRTGKPADSVTESTFLSIARKVAEGDETVKALLPYLLKTWPAPEFILGLFKTVIRTEGNPAYFLGKISYVGWAAYYPFTFLVKTSLPLLALFFASIILAVANARRLDRRELWLWTCWFVGMMFFVNSKVNLGVRYLLFLYPISIVLAAKLAQDRYFAKQAVRILVSACAIWLAITSVRAFPNYIPYFNETSGGAKNGYKLLADSNLDWGQDLILLREFLEKHPEIEELKFSYFGATNPEYYGVRCKYLYSPFYMREAEYNLYPHCEPISGWVAVSVNNYLGIYFENHDCYRWLDAYEPLYKIGHSIWIYDIE